MAEQFDAKAVLSASIEGFKQAMDDLQKVEHGIGSIGDVIAEVNRHAKGLESLSTSLGGASKAAQQSTKSWNDLGDAIAKAQSRADKGINAATAQQTRSSTALNAGNGSADWDRAYSAALESAEQKTRDLEAAQAALYEKSSPRLRYALYDVSRTATVTAASITALGVAVGGASASFESSFTNVERTLEDGVGASEVQALRDQLVGLTREMPLAFSEITDIATLGNQLGVAGDDVGKFTETVAQFSAVTGITVDAAATAFGSLGELLDVPVNQFENLGSAIAYVGRTSVATEAEIVAMSTRLAASATNAGFSAQQVIALSGAFASLRIAPERAQGVMEVYFERLNDAIASGGESLEAFGRYAGLAASDVEGLVRSDPNAFFQRLATGLGKLDSIAQTRALDQLGLDGIRAGEVFGRVSANVDVFNRALQDSDNSWAAGSELANQYAKVLDDLSTRWQILLNALAEFGAAAGDTIAPILVDLVNNLTTMIQGFTEFVSSDFGAWFVQTAATIGGFVAALATVTAAVAVAGGGLLAMRLAVVELGIVSATTTNPIGLLIARLLGLNGALSATAASGARASGALVGVGGASAKASGGMAAIGRGIGGVAKAAGALVIFDQIIRWIVDFEGQLQQVNGSLAVSQSAWANFGETGKFSIEMLYSPLGTLIGMISFAMSALSKLNIGRDWANGFGRAASGGRKSSKGVQSLKQLKAAGDALDFGGWTAGAEDFAGGLDDVGGAAGGAAEKVYTLVDYANDLQGVMKRAFDIRFGPEQGLDAIATGWHSIRNAADQAREAAEEHARTLANMGADRSIKQYWLSVAENYGDELRAAKLRAELAELDAQMAKEKQGLSAAQDQASMTLNGNSEAAIRNRAALLALVGDYQQYLTALAASGASQATLESEAQRLRAEFVQQATQMGFNRAEVDRYAQAFDDMTTIINQVPRNITVTANINPALQALNEFVAAAQRAGSAAGGGIASGVGRGVQLAQWQLDVLKTALDTVARMAEVLGSVSTSGRGYSRGGYFGSPGGGGYSGGRKSGGYTGNFGVNREVGTVHGQEFVMSAPAVRNIGVNTMARIHEAGKSGKGLGAVGVGAGGGPVDLSAGSIQALSRSLAANLQLVLPGAQLAGSVGAHNVVSARRGAA